MIREYLKTDVLTVGVHLRESVDLPSHVNAMALMDNGQSPPPGWMDRRVVNFSTRSIEG